MSDDKLDVNLDLPEQPVERVRYRCLDCECETEDKYAVKGCHAICSHRLVPITANGDPLPAVGVTKHDMTIAELRTKLERIDTLVRSGYYTSAEIKKLCGR